MPSSTRRGSIDAGTASIHVRVKDDRSAAKQPQKSTCGGRGLAALVCLALVATGAAVAAVVVVTQQQQRAALAAGLVPDTLLANSGEGVNAGVLWRRTDWVEEGSAEPQEVVALMFAVQQADEALMYETLHNVSTPGHPMRHAFLTPAALRDLVAAPASTAAVREYLTQLGATIVSERHMGLYLEAHASVATWETALNVQFGRFVPSSSSGISISRRRRTQFDPLGEMSEVHHHHIVRARGPPAVASAVAHHIAGIAGLCHLPPRIYHNEPATRGFGVGGDPIVQHHFEHPAPHRRVAEQEEQKRGGSVVAEPRATDPSAGVARRGLQTAEWLQAEGCSEDPCETAGGNGNGRRLQTWAGFGEAHICCQNGAQRRRLQTWAGFGEVNCDESEDGGSGRRLSDVDSPIAYASPLATHPGQDGVCVNGTAVNSTSIGMLRQRYKIPATGGDPVVSQAFLTPQVAQHSAADLTTFGTLYGLPSGAANVTVGCQSDEYTCDPSDATGSLESNLDSQLLVGSSPLSNTIEIRISSGCFGSVSPEPWYTSDQWELDCMDPATWLNRLAACMISCTDGDCDNDPCFGQPAPSIVSISWAVPEIDMTPNQVYAFNKGAIHLALLGITVVAASGDGGAAGIYPIPADADSSDKHYQICGSGYQPLFPASSPFVTSVGATKGLEDGLPEQACSAGDGAGITSGGGFSAIRYSSVLSPWQESHIKAYLESAEGQSAVGGYFTEQRGSDELGYSTSYDYGGSAAEKLDHRATHRRGYPDLALAGSSMQVVSKGKVILVDGTSAAAPIFAGMLTNVIAARRKAGPAKWRTEAIADTLTASGGSASADAKVTAADVTHGYRLGWLNPTLYAYASSFTDVTVGNNTDGRGIVCPEDPDKYADNYDDDNYLQYKQNGGIANLFLPRPAGFAAAVGWDPVSGLGSISNDKLAAMFPISVNTSAGDGDLGTFYYDEVQMESSAHWYMMQHSIPSPPSSSGYQYG